jgi:hypothetical protein
MIETEIRLPMVQRLYLFIFVGFLYRSYRLVPSEPQVTFVYMSMYSIFSIAGVHYIAVVSKLILTDNRLFVNLATRKTVLVRLILCSTFNLRNGCIQSIPVASRSKA